MKELIGKISTQERDQIKSLFERKNGLIELFKALDGKNELLFQKLVKDMGETCANFQKWWDDKSLQYNWQKREDGHWEVDFETCDIYIVY